MAFSKSFLSFDDCPSTRSWLSLDRDWRRRRHDNKKLLKQFFCFLFIPLFWRGTSEPRIGSKICFYLRLASWLTDWLTMAMAMVTATTTTKTRTMTMTPLANNWCSTDGFEITLSLPVCNIFTFSPSLSLLQPSYYFSLSLSNISF